MLVVKDYVLCTALVFAFVFLLPFNIFTHNVFAETVLSNIQVGSLPDGLGVDPNRNMVYVTNHNDNTTSIINGSTNIIVKTIPVGYSLVSVNPVTNEIYVDAGNSGVAVIDGNTGNVITTIPVPVGGGNVNMNTNRIYEAGCCGHDVISVIDGTKNVVIGTISVGTELSGNVAVNPNTNIVYATTICRGCGQNTSVMVIDGNTSSVITNIPIPSIWQSLDVNPNTNTIYAAAGDSVYVINGKTNQITATIPGIITGMPSIVVDPDRNMVYVADSRNGVVTVIDGSTNSVKSKISGFNYPDAIKINPNTNIIYVANGDNNTISVVRGDSSTSATVPSMPQNLQSVANNAQVSLSWSAPSSNGGSTITGYDIYRGTTSGGESTAPIVTVSASTLTYTDVGLTNGQTYFYKVTAVNSAGESASSNEASATPTAPATVSSAPTGLTANTISSSQINLSWSAPTNNGGSAITGYMIERSNNTGTTWSTVQSNTGSTATTYSDTGLAPSTAYTYRVSAINSVGTSQPSNVSSATTSAVTPPPPAGITLNNVQSTSGTVSSSNQMTLANFNAGTGNNRLLVVGISANNNNAISVTFGGVSMTQAAGSFYNNDVEFWYLKNPTGTGNVVVTTGGPTQAVVGVYSFAGVNQTTPIPTHVTKHNTTPNSPNITITTKFANDWVLDLPSIYGGSILGSPTCAQQWDVNVPDAITGASSSKMVPTPGAVTCKWTASPGDFWDDAAIEIKASK